MLSIMQKQKIYYIGLGNQQKKSKPSQPHSDALSLDDAVTIQEYTDTLQAMLSKTNPRLVQNSFVSSRIILCRFASI
jgi:hypothetical protein